MINQTKYLLLKKWKSTKSTCSAGMINCAKYLLVYVGGTANEHARMIKPCKICIAAVQGCRMRQCGKNCRISCRTAVVFNLRKEIRMRQCCKKCRIPCPIAGVSYTAVRQKVPHTVPHFRGDQTQQNIYAAVPGCRIRQCGKKCCIPCRIAGVLYTAVRQKVPHSVPHCRVV